MPKIWWRLSDVSPLAEHAVHAPSVANPIPLLRHHAAQSPLPGLIWELFDGDESLQSNGWPAWHDETGRRHRAWALGWQQTTPANCVAIAGAEPGLDLMLLTARRPRRRLRRSRPVIHTIRTGVRKGHHWFWVDTERWPFGYGTSDHRDEIVPAGATWVPATVTAAAVGHHQYSALIADGYLGADGVLPRFTRDTVTQIAADLASLNDDPQMMPGEFPTVRFDRDVAIITWQQHSLSDERVLEIDRCYPDTGGLYAIGAYQWTWQTAADQEPAAHDCLTARTVRYVAHYGAPGTGEAWQCDRCGKHWSRVGGAFHPAETGAHILTLDDIE